LGKKMNVSCVLITFSRKHNMGIYCTFPLVGRSTRLYADSSSLIT